MTVDSRCDCELLLVVVQLGSGPSSDILYDIEESFAIKLSAIATIHGSGIQSYSSRSCSP